MRETVGLVFFLGFLLVVLHGLRERRETTVHRVTHSKEYCTRCHYAMEVEP